MDFQKLVLVKHVARLIDAAVENSEGVVQTTVIVKTAQTLFNLCYLIHDNLLCLVINGGQ